MDINKLKSIDIIDKAIKISLIVGILLVSFSFFYYYVIFLPQKEQAIIELQKQEQLAKERKEQEAKEEAERKEQEVKEETEFNSRLLDACLEDAWTTYHNQWGKECKYRGQKKRL